MDRNVLEQHAVSAEERLVRGERCIDRLRLLIERMRIGGHDVEEAERLLASFKQIQASHAEGELKLMQELISLTN